MDVPGSWLGVRNRLVEAPDEVQSYFEPAGELIENYPWEVLSELFVFSSRESSSHGTVLRCGKAP